MHRILKQIVAAGIKTEPAPRSVELEVTEPGTNGDDAQLSFDIERPKPRLRVLRRHPSI